MLPTWGTVARSVCRIPWLALFVATTFIISAYAGPRFLGPYDIVPFGSETKAVQLADLNDDGRVDAIAACVSHHPVLGTRGFVAIRLGIDDGEFGAESRSGEAPFEPRDLEVADVTGDGRVDVILAVQTAVGGAIDVLPGQPTGLLGSRIRITTGGIIPDHVAVARFTNGGLPGLVFVADGQALVGTILSLPSGAFTQSQWSDVGSSVRSPAIGRLAEAGPLRMFSMSGASGIARGVRRFDFDSSGVVVSSGVISAPDSIVSGCIGDLDGDGTSEFFGFGWFTSCVFRFSEASPGVFAMQAMTTPLEASSYEPAVGMMVEDLDGDNLAEVVLARGVLGVRLGAPTTDSIWSMTGPINGGPKLTSAYVASGSKAIVFGGYRALHMAKRHSHPWFDGPSRIATGAPVIGLGVGDVDGDGTSDIAVCHAIWDPILGYSGQLALFRGPFVSDLSLPAVKATIGILPGGIAVRDLDGDGFAEVMVTDQYEGLVRVVKWIGGQLATTLERPAGSAPAVPVVGLVNADAFPDLIAPQTDGSSALLLYGNVATTFSNPVELPFAASEVRLRDWNADGLQDVLTTQKLFEGSPSGDWSPQDIPPRIGHHDIGNISGGLSAEFITARGDSLYFDLMGVSADTPPLAAGTTALSSARWVVAHRFAGDEFSTAIVGGLRDGLPAVGCFVPGDPGTSIMNSFVGSPGETMVSVLADINGDGADDIVGSDGSEWVVLQRAAPEAVVGVPAPRPRINRVSNGSVRPTPTRDEVRIEFAMSRRGEVRWELYDVAGRRVATLWQGGLAAGPALIESRLPAALGAGVYDARLTADGRVVRIDRVVVVR